MVTLTSLTQASAPLWRLELQYSLGASDSALQFYRLSDAVFLPDGTLVVADQGTSELIFVDPAGNVTSRVGKPGEGPGDFQDLSAVGIAANGTLYAYDGRQQRLTLLQDEQTFEVRRLDASPGYNPEMPLAVGADGRLIVISEPIEGYDTGLGPGRTLVELLRVHPDGTTVETLARSPGKEFHMTAEVGRVAIGFPRTTLYAGRGAHVLLGATDFPRLTLYTDGRPALTLCWEHEPTPVTAADAENWATTVMDGVPMPPEALAAWVAIHAQVGANSTLAAFGALQVDAGGQIWIGAALGLTEESRAWSVFSSSGEPVGRVRLPAYRPVPLELENAVLGWTAHELLDVSDDRIAIARRDALGDAHVEVYRVVSR